MIFDLFATESGTRVRLTHDGLDSFPKDNPDLAAENFAAGWEHIIGFSLRNFLEKGIIRKSVQVDAPPSKVWRVLIDPVFIKQWGNAFLLKVSFYDEVDSDPNTPTGEYSEPTG